MAAMIESPVAEAHVVMAAVDIGTNTIKFSVARCFAHGRLEMIEERSTTVRIGMGIERTGRVDPDRANQALEALREYERSGRDRGASRFVGVATEALRVADDGDPVLERIARETAWEVRVISGDEEARLTFTGLRDAIPVEGSTVILDIGGGSTEVITVLDGELQAARSIPVGSGRLVDRWITSDPPGTESLRKAYEDAQVFVQKQALGLSGRGGTMLLTGGNGRDIKGLCDRFAGDINARAMALVLTRLASQPADRVASLLGIQRERAIVVPAGVAIALAVAEDVRPEVIDVVPSGIRRGVMRELLTRELPQSQA